MKLKNIKKYWQNHFNHDEKNTQNSTGERRVF